MGFWANLVFQIIFMSAFLAGSAFVMDTDIQRVVYSIGCLLCWLVGGFYGRLSGMSHRDKFYEDDEW